MSPNNPYANYVSIHDFYQDLNHRYKYKARGPHRRPSNKGQMENDVPLKNDLATKEPGRNCCCEIVARYQQVRVQKSTAHRVRT